MDKAARRRWAVLLSLLSATLGAVFYPMDDPALPAASVVPKVAAARTTIAPLAPDEAEVEPAGDPDPFAPRGWLPPPPPPPSAAPQVVAPVFVGPPVPPPPPAAPPLPFRFMGSLNDGAEQTVYLARGDEAVVAHAGDVLDGTYKVRAITGSQIEFEHIPTHQKQSLPFPTRDN